VNQSYPLPSDLLEIFSGILQRERPAPGVLPIPPLKFPEKHPQIYDRVTGAQPSDELAPSLLEGHIEGQVAGQAVPKIPVPLKAGVEARWKSGGEVHGHVLYLDEVPSDALAEPSGKVRVPEVEVVFAVKNGEGHLAYLFVDEEEGDVQVFMRRCTEGDLDAAFVVPGLDQFAAREGFAEDSLLNYTREGEKAEWQFTESFALDDRAGDSWLAPETADYRCRWRRQAWRHEVGSSAFCQYRDITGELMKPTEQEQSWEPVCWKKASHLQKSCWMWAHCEVPHMRVRLLQRLVPHCSLESLV
jgi:hypothetical protein